MDKFKKLGLSEPILKAIEDMKFEEPSDIQTQAIPLVLAGKDVIGGSSTGSGKTLAFSAPIIDNLKRGKGVQALILTPTRELAQQVAQETERFAKYNPLKITTVYGGVGIEPQISKLKTADVVVGTPGRILDHMQRNTIKLEKVKFLVLDEVDRMFDMGFYDDVNKIISQVPEQRQTMLFSATISQDIDHLAKKHTKDAIEVAVESMVDATKLKQVYYDVEDGLKFSLLVHLLKNEKSELVMVFCATRRNVDFVEQNLKKNGVEAKAIHGGLSQNSRTRVLDGFHKGHVNVMVCTDVAARGLDIKGVSHVYNFDIPKTADEYIHRIGRTARAGKDGIAISILASRDYDNFGKVEKDEKIKIEKLKTPYVERVPIDTNGFGKNRFRGRSDGDRGNFRSGSRSFSGGRDNRGGGSRNFDNKKKFGDKPRFSGGRRFERRDGDSSGKSFGDSKRYGDKKFGDKPRFGGRDGDRRSFGGPKKFGDKPRFGEKKSYGRSEGGGRRFERRDGDSGGKSFGGDKKFGDKPRFGNRDEGKRSFGGTKKFGDKPRFGGRDDRKFGERNDDRKFDGRKKKEGFRGSRNTRKKKSF
ncbi:MAG: DEAD/DEAH box helicase [Nanoarchaeota archaeon]|nr:DEAD/DEAH box helicase [Nanoarchaeota archaeon]